MKQVGISFPLALIAFQVLLLALFAGFVDYDYTKSGHNNKFYAQFQDIHVMIFIGFGFLMTFLKKYGYGALSYNLLLAAATIQWATLINAWIKQRMQKNSNHFEGNPTKIKVGVTDMITADFTATAVLISYGAVIGKASRVQLFVMTIVECVIFAINENIIMEYLKISDVGGTIVLHVFGAYFGLAVSFILKNHSDLKHKEGSEYHSDIFSMIGTLFLWVFWPSFNAGLLGDKSIQQSRALVNTYFSLAACVLTSFACSSFVNKKFKLNMVHIQNATLAGGVAVGTCADLMIKPWGAIMIGMFAGCISVLGYNYLTPILNKHKIHDTCGVHNLHGMPGVFGALCGAVAAAAIKPKSYYDKDDFLNIYTLGEERTLVKQGCFQLAALLVSLTLAIVGGLMTGLLVNFFQSIVDDDHFDDKGDFEIPADHEYCEESNKDQLMNNMNE
ncbi:ammonium transporter Rh type A isoform X1 [Hydra vulgaris]|uniref:ammonium transporter Rh type A isoform X1 n=1 Tax=Hydra vulgaris TaxID=6087 RepID=UPI00064132A5|nr:ammonium transporter Rh type A [Hydra vulgaris]